MWLSQQPLLKANRKGVEFYQLYKMRTSCPGDKALEQRNRHLKEKIMGKGQDAKKNVKKEPTKTPKERKAEKRLKKSLKQLHLPLKGLLANDKANKVNSCAQIFPVK